MRGRKPIPTNVRLLRGDIPSMINDDEPVPSEGIPTCPSKHPEIKKIWEYTVDQLSKMRTVTMADRDTLLAYCEAVNMHRIASQLMAKEGVVIPGSHGGLVCHPAQKIQREAAQLIRALGTEFGLTPSARTRIKVTASEVKAETGAARLLSG